MSLSIFAERHPVFFDLRFIRETNGDMAALGDDEIVRRLTDPGNQTPPDPNCIFRVAYYNDARAQRGADTARNPITHYLEQGERDGIPANPFFDAVFFRRNAGWRTKGYASLVECALDSLAVSMPGFHPFIDLEFIQRTLKDPEPSDLLRRIFLGEIDLERPHPLFDVGFIRAHADRDIADMGDAFDYYWSCGQDIPTHALFDIDYYKQGLGSTTAISHSVFHYLVDQRPSSPQPMLDFAYYRERACAAAVPSPDRPLEHFITDGQRLGIDPSPYFDLAHYRAQSGCGEEALHHYLAGGHREFAPHPMVSRDDDALFEQASKPSSRPLGRQLAEQPADVPLAVTPDFDPVFYRNRMKTEVFKQSDISLRDHYLRHRYPKGMPPNGLLSPGYIRLQARINAVCREEEIQTYFREGWHRRPRLLIVIRALDDTPLNQDWIRLLRRKLDAPETEMVVLAGEGGPLMREFRELAHVWCISEQPVAVLASDRVRRSVVRLSATMKPNPPVGVIVDTDCGSALIDALSEIEAPKFAFRNGRSAPLSQRQATELSALSNLVLLQSVDIDEQTERVDGQGAPSARADFRFRRVVVPPAPKHAPARDEVRHILGRPETEIIVASNGPLDLDHGVDIFGALAAHCFRHEVLSSGVTFVWHGTGRTHSNSPAFYAKHFAETAAEKGRLHILDDIDFSKLLEASDVYVKMCRGSVTSDLIKAKAAGLPIVMSRNHAEADELVGRANAFLFDAYDLDALRGILAGLVTERMRGAFLTDAASASGQSLVGDADRPLMFLLSKDDPVFGAALGLGQLTTYLGAPAVRLDRNDWSALDMPEVLGTLLESTRSDEMLIFGDDDTLSQRLISAFEHSICWADGGPINLGDLVRLGLGQDGLSPRPPNGASEPEPCGHPTKVAAYGDQLQ